MSVTVSYTDGDLTAESVTSANTAAVANINDAVAGALTITGTVAEDATISADTSGLSDADGLGAFTYQWLRDGAPVGADADTYTLDDIDVGAVMSVSVSYTDGYGAAESITSTDTAAVTNVNDPIVGNVVVTGTAAEDFRLTADASGLSDVDGLLEETG